MLNNLLLSSGGQTRTDDLRVMSPTSYQLLHPAIYRFDFGSFSRYSRPLLASNGVQRYILFLC